MIKKAIAISGLQTAVKRPCHNKLAERVAGPVAGLGKGGFLERVILCVAVNTPKYFKIEGKAMKSPTWCVSLDARRLISSHERSCNFRGASRSNIRLPVENPKWARPGGAPTTDQKIIPLHSGLTISRVTVTDLCALQSLQEQKCWISFGSAV